MARAIFGLVSIVAAIAIIIVCYGNITPDITTMLPGLNRSLTRTVALESSTPTESGRTDSTPGAAGHSAPSAPGGSPAESPGSAPEGPESPSSSGSRTAEIIAPNTTLYLNPTHTRDVTQPLPSWASPASGDSAAGNPNPAAFVPPDPLPAHPHWTWDVLNREFTDVVVTHVDADVVTINSDSGPARVEIALLPADVRQELHYNPGLAAQAAEARQSAAAPVTVARP